MIRTIVIALLAAGIALACASTTDTGTTPSTKKIVKAEPVRQPERAPADVAVADRAPVQLPKTASPLPGIGLAGLAALALGAGTRALRRRL